MKYPSRTEMELLRTVACNPNQSGRVLAHQYVHYFGKPMPFGTLYTLLRRLKHSGWISTSKPLSKKADCREFQFNLSPKAADLIDRIDKVVEATEALERALKRPDKRPPSPIEKTFYPNLPTPDTPH